MGGKKTLIKEIEILRLENEELKDKLEYFAKLKNIAFKMVKILRFTSNSHNEKLSKSSSELVKLWDEARLNR